MLTQEVLKQHLDYDPDTGVFIRKTGYLAGTVAGYIGKNGYRYISVRNKDYLAHRLAWLYMHGAWPQNDIDHKNRVRLDNRIENLRDVTKSVNLLNQGLHTDNTSGVRNVYWHKQNKKWVVNRNQNNKRYYVGSFETIEEAAQVAKQFYQ